MKLQLLLTGNELMSGHTVDSNSAMIAELLSNEGIVVQRKVTLGDDFSELLKELESISQSSDVLIVNGGLGPTIDDLTAQALSQLTGRPLTEHAQALKHLTQWCTNRKLAINESNLKQAILPEGVDIIPNPTGSAVGFSLEYKQCLILCTPGVPSELLLMMEQSIVGLIARRFPNSETHSTIRFQTFGMGESSLQELINSQYTNWPQEVELGFRAGMPLLEVKLTIRSDTHSDIQKECYRRMQQLIGHYIIGENSATLATSVIDLLNENNSKLTTAESCTGGLIAASITENAGASAVFEAGFVTYSNAIKESVINVDKRALEEQGAVSEVVARQMVQGAIDRSGSDYAIAVTGIAGPDGGSAEKPVGTVWVAWGTSEFVKTRRLLLPGKRRWFQQMVAAITLDLLRRELLSIEEEPRYLRRYQ
jgi:nicotinamide-nucleotide amidase